MTAILARTSAAAPSARSSRAHAAIRLALLLAGLAAIALARAQVNGIAAWTGFAAGAGFGAGALGLAWAGGWQPSLPRWQSLAWGVAGGAVLIAVPVVAGAIGLGMRPQPFVLWVAITVLVATAEEVLLRGALLEAAGAAFGLPVAIGLTSVAFALLHVPLYGWGVVPLDLAAGVWLAGLRLSGGLGASVTAHILADLATWWL
jgi:membrane protease YdiL (CAAX protease family)